MEFILFELLIAAGAWVLRSRAALQSCANGPDGDGSDDGDGEPVLDFDAVRDDVELICDLIEGGDIDGAHVEAVRLFDRMHGIDEAARTDRRWAEFKQTATG